ncbi:MAG: DUF1127 domain-containing protein [Acetobacteraceae bacterium]|nr:DUF1127 domain-containing protein [Acetobacteraceae bacterium]
MSTSLFRSHFGTLPLGLTSLSQHDAGAAATIPAKLIHHAGTWLDRIRALGSQHATLNELAMLSDHELADIGLNRSDIPRVFDPDFVAEHNKR